MATKKQPTRQLSSFDELDAAGIGAGYTPYGKSEPTQPVEAPVEPRGAMRAVADTAVQFGKGAVTGVRMMSDVFGADNAVSGGLRTVDDALAGLLSATAKQDQAQVAAIMQEAEGKGWMEQIGLGLKAAGVAPGALLAQAAGTAIPTLAASLATGGAGPMATMARFAAPALMGGAQGVGATKGAIYDNTKQELLKAGATPAEAEARAVDQQSYGGDSAGQIALGGGLGVLAGGIGMERMVHGLRNGVTKSVPGIMGRMGVGGATEAVPELLQGGQEKYATNSALNNEGFKVDPMSGVVANATMEGAAGFGMGAAFGIPRPAVTPQQAEADAIRAAELVPASGPMSIAANAGTEAKAAAVEQAPTASITGADPAQMLQDQAMRSNPFMDQIRPSQAAGINPAAGPMSAAGAVALDSGATQAIQLEEANAADQAAYEQAAATQEQQVAEQDTADKPITTGKLAEAQMSEEDKRAILFSNQAVVDGGIQFEGTQDGDVLNGMGAPFKTKMAALRRATMEGKDWSIAPVFDGYVARRKDAMPAENNTPTASVGGNIATLAETENQPNQPLAAESIAPVATENVAAEKPKGGMDYLMSLEADAGQGFKSNDAAIDIIKDATQGMTPAAKASVTKAINQFTSIQKDGTRLIKPYFYEEVSAKFAYVEYMLSDAVKRATNTPVAPTKSAEPAPVTQPVQPVTGEGAGGSQPTQVAAAKFTLDPFQWDAKKLSDAYSMEQLNTLHSEVQSQFSNKTVSGSPIDERGMATKERLNADGQKMEIALKKAIGVVYEKRKQVAAAPVATKDQTKALDRIAKGTAYFGNAMKAGEFVAKNGLKETHEAVKTSATRWDIVAKDSQPTESTNEPTPPITQQAAQEGSKAPAAEVAPELVKTKTAQGITTYVRQSDLDGDQDVIRMFTKDGASNGRIHRENIDPTGAKQAERNAENASNPLFDVITNKEGGAFATVLAARRALNQKGLQSTHIVAKASDVSAGSDGFVIRKREATEAKPVTPQLPPAAPVAPAEKNGKAEVMRELAKINEQMPEGFEATDGPLGVGLFKDGKPIENVQGLSRVNGYSELLRQANLRAPVAQKQPAAEPISDETKARNLLMELQAKQDANGMVGDDRLETQINQVKREIKAMDGAEKPATDKPAPSANTIFTEDAAAAARARLKAKLGRLNSGLDPETMMDGITLAGYHIEKGARSFAAFTSAMIGDLGDAVKPYLKSWYMGVKFDPRAAAFDGMDSSAAVEGADLDKLAATDDAPQPTKTTLATSLFDAIQSGNMPKDNPALKKLVEAFDGKPADPARMKAAQEQLETAIVMTARAVVAKNEGDKTTFDVLERLYNSQPNLNIRTSTSIANQAYSTPAPLAFIASRLAGITGKSSVLEPTAGNGMLVIGANIDNTSTNEINDERIASLKSQGFSPSQNDATEGFASLAPQDAIVTNPPFGSVKGADGKPIKVKVDGYDIGQIDHLIAARALATMKEDGQATLIIGANKVAGGLNTDDRIFFNWLYGHYNVVGHFEVDGDLYTRQGAAWPVRVIVIKGRNKSNTFSPLAGTVKRVNNWSDVYEQYQTILAASRQPVRATSAIPERNGGGKAGSRGVSVTSDTKTPATDRPVATGSPGGAGDVAGTSTGAVPNSAKPAPGAVGAGADEQRLHAQPDGARGLEPAGAASSGAAGRQPAKPAGTTALSKPGTGNQFQAPYIPRSARKDEGVLIPTNMAQPTQDALSALEDEVGDIDEFARKELGYATTDDLHTALMGLQVDSVATAIYQIKKGKAVVIADQTGIGKGRQAAAIIRWTVKQGYTPVFISVKPSLFTDMYGDLADIGTDDVQPFVLNGDAWVAGADGSKLFANKPATHKRRMEAIEASGQLPDGSNAVFMTYSQINKDNLQRRVLMSLAPNAVFILDESHNAAGASSTGEFVIGALELAKGVTYLSATYAKRPDNMPLYFKTDIGNAAADTDGLAQAMAAGGLPLQTVVSNNLVKAGQMFRRERSYDGVQISSVFDTKNRDLHEQLSNEATKALRALVSADKSFHSVYVKTLGQALAAQGESVQDSAGNQAAAGVQHTEFSSVVHNFVKQMLLGLKAQSAADEAIASLKRGEKPIIAVESTMGSFLNEYATSNNIAQGEELGAFDYRTVLSRALERSRVIIIKDAQGNETKRKVPLSELDVITARAYQSAQAVIDGLKLSIPVSPIDWMRAQIIKAGYSVAEITGRNLSVDYSNPKKPILSAIDQLEQSDKVNTTRQFNSGKLDALILNVAGSTGISLHASEKFSDQRQRHMIVAQAAGDINIFMQMLGRIHRTGQVALPKYTILSVDLPTEKRPTAVLSIKMKSLNANTSSNTESATSVKTSDILNKYGDQIVSQYLVDNYALAVALDVQDLIGGEDAQDDIARKVTGRLALQPIEVQHAFYDEVEGQYNALIEYLNKTNQNDLEPRTFDFDAKETRQEVLFEGPDKSTPFGEDAIYGEYSIKAQGIAMKPEEIRDAMKTSLEGKDSVAHVNGLVSELLATWTAQVNANRAKNGLVPGAFDPDKYGAFMAGLYGKDAAAGFVDRATKQIASGQDIEDITVAAMESTQGTSEGMEFMREHAIGKTFRIDINSEPYNAVVTNIRSTHKTTGSPFSLSKVQLTVSVNGALRSLTIPGTQFRKIVVSAIQGGFRIDQLFKEQPPNQRETAKIVTGNLLAAYGEIEGARGTIISFTKQDGTTEQGILLPKLFDYSKNTRGDYRLPDGAAALRFLQQSDNKDIGRFGITSRDGNVRVLPAGQGIRVQVPKSKAKGGKFFLDKALIEAGGDFVSSGNYMVSTVYDRAPAEAMLDLLMKKQALYALPSMAEEAKAMGDGTAFSRSAMKSVDANIRRGMESLAKALDEKTTVNRAMFRNGMGWVDFVWGSEGSMKPSGKTKGAMGLSHIIEARQRKDGLSDSQVSSLLSRIVTTIAEGKETARREFESIINATIAHNGIEVVLIKNKGSNTWLMNGWHEKNPGAIGAGYVASNATSSTATTAQRGKGAGFANIVAQELKSGNAPMSRSATPTRGLPTAQVTSIVDAIRARWGNAPEIIIAADMSDPLIPQKVRDQDQMQKSQGATGEPEGFVYRGKVYILASELATPTDVMRVLFHESIGHLGLRGVFGDKLKPILQQLAALRRGDVAAKAKQYGLDMNTEAGRLEAAEEVLAEMAQTKPELGYVQRAIALIRRWLRANVPGFSNMKMTDAEIVAQFILPARRFVEGKGGPKGGMKSPASGNIATQPAFSRGLGATLTDAANNTQEALKNATVTDLLKQFGNRLGDFRGLGLQTLGRRQLVDIYGKDLPAMVAYSDMVAQMEADKNESGAEADGLATDWGKLKDERQLAELMHDATLAQIDPSKDFVEGDDANFYDALKDGYDKLTPDAKKAFLASRDMYSAHNEKVRKAIRERITRSELSSTKKQALLERMDGEFFKKVKGVYFPLARFGSYVTIVKDSEGNVVSANRSETMNEAEATRKVLQTQFPASGGFKVGKVLRDREFNAARDGVGRGFMADLFQTLEKTGAGEELMDSISQLYLAALPDLSWAKHGIHRKGTPGFSQDARRAFAQNMFHGARYLAKLRYADQLQTGLDTMQKQIAEQVDNEAYDSVKSQQVVDEMVKRHESLMNPASNPLSTALTSLGFVFHLGLSPASALVNLSQTALVSLPIMGAKWGFTKSSAALLVASKQAAGNKNDISTVLKGDERMAYDEAVRRGVIDVTMAHDLAGIAQGEDSKVSAAFKPVMKYASFLFHHAEKFNRQVTFVASYRLAREAGAAHEAAFDDAVKATYDGHFDYGAANRPRLMQGNVARVVFLFKQYAQNMIYTLTRNAQQAIKAETPEGRAEARKALAGLLVSHAMAAGVFGLPVVGMLLSAASAIGGDDDEPWDAKVALQNMLADSIGPKAAEVFAHGLSRLTPWDISGRVGLDRLLLPDVQEGLEGTRAAESWAAQALGPVVGIGINMAKGLSEMGKGEYQRGLESMLPSALRGPMKAYRLETEGNIDKSGVAINENVSGAGVAGQALGFSPSETRLAQEGKSAIYSADRAIQARRTNLVRQFALASMATDAEGVQDARKDIARFNEKNPKARITQTQLVSSIRARQRRINEAKQGVYLPSKRQDAMEAGRFAVTE